MRRTCLALALMSGVAMRAAPAPPAPHRILFVPVDAGVNLEVLDWGGHGPTLVFLAGFGNTAHVFDDFAPQLSARHHVLAITRRGFGASSHPSSGYDTRTLARDIVAVMDSLGIRRASFAGHSFAGTELSFLGAEYADRVSALVYLDASYDFAHLYRDPRWQRAFPIPKPAPPTSSDLSALRRWFDSMMGPAVPDDELRNLSSGGAVIGLDTTLQRGAYPTELRGIKVPVLALWAAPRSVQDWYPFYGSLDPVERTRMRKSFDAQMAVRREHLQTFRAQVRGARVVRVVGARHFVFLTHPGRVVGEISAFLASPSVTPLRRTPR